jgi:hypothetical protein
MDDDNDPNDLGVIRGRVPVDRLTRLSVRMTECLDEPAYEDVKAIVFLHDAERGGIQIHGYDDDTEAMVDLFVHMKAVFQGMGKDLTFVGIPDGADE